MSGGVRGRKFPNQRNFLLLDYPFGKIAKSSVVGR